jgi:NAD(P)-dependent dehydrogenase (short-subunit alcohol dehydrogenase family)
MVTHSNIYRKTPTHKVLDVNLLGSMYVCRIASVYLRHNRGSNCDRSILLFSCVSGFKDSPSLFIYQASKHGVVGLMRSLRTYISSPYKHYLRINSVCPWVTQTNSIKKVEAQWKGADLPINTPEQVATVATGVLTDHTLNGKSMFIEGGRAWEIEENIGQLESEWLGEAPSKALALGQGLLTMVPSGMHQSDHGRRVPSLLECLQECLLVNSRDSLMA